MKWQLVLVLAVLLAVGVSANASVYTWNTSDNSGTFIWETPSYWGGSGYPNAVGAVANINTVNSTIDLNGQTITLAP